MSAAIRIVNGKVHDPANGIDGELREIHSPGQLPEMYEHLEEPIARASILLPTEYIGAMMQIATDHRGVYVRQEYLSTTRVLLVYDIPLAEVIYDMHDRVKSVTRGYGTMDYELVGYFPADLVRLDILVGGNRIDALSIICDKVDADRRGRAVVKKLRDEIDRHMFEIAIQAAIGTRVIARETISAMSSSETSSLSSRPGRAALSVAAGWVSAASSRSSSPSVPYFSSATLVRSYSRSATSMACRVASICCLSSRSRPMASFSCCHWAVKALSFS